MIWENKGLRIVQSYPGQGTAETIFITEDGSRWKHDPHLPVSYCSSETVPRRIGHLKDGYIK